MTDEKIEEIADELASMLINSKGEPWVDILFRELKRLLK